MELTVIVEVAFTVTAGAVVVERLLMVAVAVACACATTKLVTGNWNSVNKEV